MWGLHTVTTVLLGPQIECPVGKSCIFCFLSYSKKNLDDLPSTNRCCFGSICAVRIDYCPASVSTSIRQWTNDSCVVLVCTVAITFVRKADSERLREIKHVGSLIPRVRVQLRDDFFSDVTRPVLQEQSDK